MFQYVVLASVCLVAVVGLLTRLDPWVICQRMFLAALVTGFGATLINFWFSNFFKQQLD